MSVLPLSPQVFSILSALVEERSGLHFQAAQLPAFAEKVSARAQEAGFESLLDYYYFLRYDAGGAGETQELVDSLVVGETYFFRELAALEMMVSRFVVPGLGGGRRIRIWCAACATGEEPHTVALLLAARGILEEVEIIASDISATAVERARNGRFTRRALRQELPAFARPWLKVVGEQVVVASQLTRHVDWRRINLLDEAAVSVLGSFDVILCRNVLIYFDESTVRAVVRRLGASLRHEGALFVGVSESLLRFGTSLACEEQDGVFFYRKVE
jgi:chemotaxis protein methyltransferase CheR